MEPSHPLADDINNRIVFWSMWVCYMYRVEELAYQQSDQTGSVLMRQTTLFLRVFYTNFVPLQYLN